MAQTNYLRNLQEMDIILAKIYNKGLNSATHEEIFGEKDEKGNMIGWTVFMNDRDRQLECLRHLQILELIGRDGDRYYSTYEGILKESSGGFVKEHKRSVSDDRLNRMISIGSFVISIVSLAFSLFL